uniref:Integrin, alpha 2 (CD49B, alpha 2 subunit of VLA-2 receptor), tandem duplicate 2 n=1 Tax=Astyanax mexicanus TaxID=7994 RepID=A0A8B9JRV0_ASTMX
MLCGCVSAGWRVQRTVGFNVGISGAKVFSGAAAEEFGYTVQQFSNHQGKWLLVGSPWAGYPQNRKGDVYKCLLTSPASTCERLNLQNSVNIPSVQNINTNMSLGQTLITRVTKNNNLMTCGPLWTQSCGSQYFVPGVCAEVSPLFAPQPAISPALQTCGGPMDIAFVLDGSNSIYPWEPVVAFLKKVLENLDIGPQQAQVSVVQYGSDPRFEFNLNTYKNKQDMVAAASKITQKGGLETNTFGAISYARKNAFLTSNGGRLSASKVMVVVTDGESHDNSLTDTVIGECNKDGITRFGIAVLGYYIRNNIDTTKLIAEIKSIASIPTEKYYFNVSDEVALSGIAGTLGDRIFNIEGTGKGGEFQMEMSQVGFSAHQTKNEDVMMLGAVGAYGWIGTVVHKTAQKSEIFPKQAFEEILQDKNHSSLLGYSVSTLVDSSAEYFVAGAPRSNHTGQVVVYILNSQRQPRIIDSQRGDQIGSYFGSVLCPLDVDRDGVTDLLLVGAPMYMSDQKKETGKVYVFSIRKGILISQDSLEGSSPLENSRFGMAIAAVPDLNLDGFADVVIGAPLEDNNRGAIYIYNGDKKSIRKQSSQKILGSKLDATLKFFGRSLDGSGDLNGDSLPDVSVGGYGNVLQLCSSPLLVTNDNRKISFIVTVMNRRENAYNTRITARYSSNLFYSSVTPPMCILYCSFLWCRPLQVSGGVFPVSLVHLNVQLPISTKAGNPLIYITSVSTAPVRMHNAFFMQINHITISNTCELHPTPKFRFFFFFFNCKTASCKKMTCVLKDVSPKTDYYVNVTAWIWNGTFAMDKFIRVTSFIELHPLHPFIFFYLSQVAVTVSKPGAKADVPIGVIVGSVIGGLLLLALAVVALWKVRSLSLFFKLNYFLRETDSETEELSSFFPEMYIS